MIYCFILIIKTCFFSSLVYSGKAKSCKKIKDLVPSLVSDIYKIEVDGEKLKVRCEMSRASGGWTVSYFLYPNIN